MTSKLKDRLSRLELARAGVAPDEVPQAVTSVLVMALAYGGGDYQRGSSDCLSDAFSRALGFADRGDLDRRLGEDSSIWESRIREAYPTMFAKHGLNGDTITDADRYAVIARILRGSAWGPNDAVSIEADLRVMRQYYGLPLEETTTPEVL